jgi:hypothetical protein
MTDAKITCWHVTSAAQVIEILKEGFRGNWGDAGYGVYLFSDFDAAEDYADEGGWDGSLQDPIILEVQATASDVAHVIPDPNWPNPDDYEHVLWAELSPDTDPLWRPEISQL